MTTSILQTFLRARLIEFHGDDTRLAKLNQAVDDVTRALLETPSLVPAFLVVALDSTVMDDPVFHQIAAKIEDHWPTYGTAFPEPPVTVFRAVALDALNKAQQEDATIALAITLLARNLMPLAKLGIERAAVQAIMDDAASKTDAGIETQWAPPFVPSSVAPISLPTSGKLEKVDRKVLLAKLEAASGPHNAANQVGPSPNPHWPNVGNPWSYEFAPRMAVILADAVDAMADVLAKSRGKADAAAVAASTAFIQDLNSRSSANSQAMERKVSLLWWRESLYSQTADAGYRSLDPILAVAHMAVDVAALLPTAYPKSVEFYLREAVRAVAGTEASEARSGLAALAQGIVSAKPSALMAAIVPGEISVGRQLMIQDIVRQARGDASTQSGLLNDADITLGDFSVWLLRELKALDALKERPPYVAKVDAAGTAPIAA